MRVTWTAGALGLLLAASACRGGGASVVGRWERVGQPREWVRFDPDRTFTATSYMDTVVIRGRYQQRGETVTLVSATGRADTLTVRDTLLTMRDGTRFRRARGR